MRYVLYALAVLGAFGLLSWLYAWLVPESSDVMPSEIVGGEPAGFDPLEVLSAQTTSPIALRNEVELLVNGEEIFPPMLEAIRGARETVDFLTFVYWTGDIAEQFADALADASERGVRVRVLLDAIGAAKMPDPLIERLEVAGCEVAWYHPISWYTLRRLNYRTHRKVLVVDREVAFTGGVGIADEWNGDARGPEEWRDNHFRIRGPAVRHLHAGFAENWRRATGEVLAQPIPEDSLAERGTALATPLATSPRGRQSDIAIMYWLMFVRAERTVDVATPYFVPDESLVETMEATARRGVRVRLLVPGPHLDKKIVRWASYEAFGDLIEAGVEVWEFQPSMMHAKAVVTDGRWSVIGSANFDNRSMDLNDELVLLVDDERLAADITEAFERDLQRSERLLTDQIGGFRIHKRFLSWAGLLLREQL